MRLAYRILGLIWLGITLTGALAWAQAPDFSIINEDVEPTGDGIFVLPFGVPAPIRVEAKPETLSKIEDYLERAAAAHESLYGTRFDQTVAPRISAPGFPSFVPLFIGDDPASDGASVLPDSIGGPVIYSDGYYQLPASTPLIRKSYIDALEGRVPEHEQSVDAQLPILAASYAIAAFNEASQCKGWPIKDPVLSTDAFVMDPTTPVTPTSAFFSTIMRARAYQGVEEVSGRFGSNGYRASIITAQNIARSEVQGMRPDLIEAEIEKWLGGASLRTPAFRANARDQLVPDAFADPFVLTAMSSASPEALYGLKSGEFNALARFDTAFACGDASAFRDNFAEYLDRYQTAFEDEAQRVGNPGISLRRSLMHAQLHKIYLPQLAANESENSLDAYERSFLNPEKWMRRMFARTDAPSGCIVIDFGEDEWLEVVGDIPPFSVRCLRIKPADEEEVRTFSVTLKIEGDDQTEEAYSDLLVSDAQRSNVGIVSKSNDVYSDREGEMVKTWLYDTSPHSDALMRERDGSKLLFVFNVSEKLSETRSKRVLIDVVQGNAKSSITAIRRVQENGRNKPAVEYKMPAIPENLTTRVSFDLQSKEDYADPKLKLTYTYAKGMEGLMNDLAKVSGQATAPVTGQSFPIMMRGGKTEIDLIEDQGKAVASLAEQLAKIQADARNNRFPETVNVVIEAPAPEPGFIGLLEDVLISVNWSDETGRPHDVESIGPEDMSASPDNEIYLNNGTLNVRRFERGVFIADFNGQLTHEPVLPPMMARRPHLNRDIAGRAQGTVVATGLDVVVNATREVADDFKGFEELGATSERVRARTDPEVEEETNRPPAQRTSSTSTSQSGIGSGPQSCDCSCDTYWTGAVSRQCTSICRLEYLVCRADGMKESPERLVAHADAIAFFWEAMGLTSPADQATSRQKITAMTDKEFQDLLEGIEAIGGPKAK